MGGRFKFVILFVGILCISLGMFSTGNYSIPNKILSISKSYIRPIVRGKEVKKVEFGAKANMIQVDEISIPEKPKNMHIVLKTSGIGVES